ncbi:MAG: iron-containing alcohol dehydrogenase family protein [Lachnospiraceae bacterium]|nr:iron-containing alcohol dehydrogenase family protein [Lachnospiraceae bacterium]
MEFYIPTKIYHEDNAVLKHGDEIASLGRKAIIITGRNSAVLTGALDDVIKVLEDNNTEYIFYDVEQNPSVATVMGAADAGRKYGADFVIGIGGGSPMDAAKAVALMVQNRDTPEEVLYQPLKLKSLPVAEIPTTCGTGSEVTPYAILTRNDIKTKQSISHRIYPAIACIDAKYLDAAPSHIIRNTAIDALGHLLESYFNANATEYSRLLSINGIEKWAENKNALAEKEFTKDNYNGLLLASTLAGMAISHTGTSLPHGLSYYLTYNKGIAHGRAVGVFLAGYLYLMEKNSIPGYKDIISKMGFKNIKEFKEFIENCIGYIPFNEEDKENMVKEIKDNPKKLLSMPFEAKEDDIREIINYKVN